MRYIVDCRYKAVFTTGGQKLTITRFQPFLSVEAPKGASTSIVQDQARKAVLASEPTATEIVCTIRG